MRILLGNNSLAMLAGSETWTFTLATELKKMGHHVACFSPELGVISHELEKKDIHSYNNFDPEDTRPFSYVLEEKVSHEYDVIISGHHHIVEYLRSRYPKTPIICVIHGIMHFLENGEKAPEHPSLSAGVNQFVAVSEEVQEKLREDYNIDSVIVRNFIDCERFNLKRPVSENKPKQILFNSNYNLKNDSEIEIMRSVAKHYGAKLAAVGMNFSQTFDVSRAIEHSDIVVGMGRSVLEGIAAGRLGIVHGRWGTAGVVREDNIQAIKRVNFSGRNSGGSLMTPEEIIAEIDRYYNPETIEWGKNYIKREHNVVTAAETFLRISRELIEGPVAQESELRPYRRAKDVARTS
jgi:hypothetical protein